MKSSQISGVTLWPFAKIPSSNGEGAVPEMRLNLLLSNEDLFTFCSFFGIFMMIRLS